MNLEIVIWTLIFCHVDLDIVIISFQNSQNNVLFYQNNSDTFYIARVKMLVNVQCRQYQRESAESVVNNVIE
jgi:hypothetical protein